MELLILLQLLCFSCMQASLLYLQKPSAEGTSNSEQDWPAPFSFI